VTDANDPIPQISRDDEAAGSGDLVAGNIARLKALFPEIVTDGKVDFDVLRDLLGDAVEEGEERYGLNWKGKRKARAFALTPSLGTLLPAPEDSVDWDTTQNLMIEGDNLEVLKLLRRSYAGEVKVIYIDPPYNTGNDFVYLDNYKDSVRNYLTVTGQYGEFGETKTTEKEAGGRFHTGWLNMIYPRIILAAELLADDGAIFVSIDESEIANLRYVMDEAFGSESFVAVISVLSNPKGRSQDKHFATNHEYVVVYGKKSLPKGHFSIAKDQEKIAVDYPEEDEGGKFRYMELRNTHREFGRFNRKDLYYPLYVRADGTVSLNDEPGAVRVVPDWDDGFEGCWTWGKEKARNEISLLVGREARAKTKIYRKSYATGSERMIKTIVSDKEFITERGQREFSSLFSSREKIFQSPKSPFLIKELVRP
jgi:adenine-specific DNA-methyltransferase